MLLTVATVACANDTVPPPGSGTSSNETAQSTSTGSNDSTTGTAGGSAGETTGMLTDTTGGANSTSAAEPCTEVHRGSLYVLEDTDLSTFKNLGHVTESLYIRMGDRPQSDLSFLGCLHTVDGAIRIKGNTYLESTAGLVNVTTLGGLIVLENMSLRTITGFDKIQETSLVQVSRNPLLDKIEFDSLKWADYIQIGECAGMEAAADQASLMNISGFSGVSRVTRLHVEGNEALTSADILDVLIQNGDPMPLEHARFRYNPLLPEADVNEKLSMMGAVDTEVCGNKEGSLGCICLVG